MEELKAEVARLRKELARAEMEREIVMERPVSDRARTDERLSVAVRAAHEAGRHTCGTRRVHARLVSNGVAVGRDRVGRLRRQLGLRCKQKRCFRVTTDSAHTLPVADNRERPVTPY
jgi:transposase InsO family protein